MLSIGIECNNCDRYFRTPIENQLPINCKNCNTELGTIQPNWKYDTACPFCQNTEFYKRKDFNQIIGLIIIILGGVLAIMINYIFLLLVVIVDFLLIKIIPDVGICYRCSTEFRGISDTHLLSGFSHNQAELFQK